MKSANEAHKEIEKLKQEVRHWIEVSNGFQDRLKEIHRIAHTKSITFITKNSDGSSQIVEI